MKFLAGYSLFILVLVLVFTVKGLKYSENKKERNSNIAGIVLISPCILFFVLTFLGA